MTQACTDLATKQELANLKRDLLAELAANRSEIQVVESNLGFLGGQAVTALGQAGAAYALGSSLRNNYATGVAHGERALAEARAAKTAAEAAKTASAQAGRDSLVAKGKAIAVEETTKRNTLDLLRQQAADRATSARGIQQATRQSLIAEGKALAANNAAKKAALDALYAESRAASAANAAAKAGGNALKALSQVGSIFSIITTFASLASVAALAEKVVQLRGDFEAYKKATNKKLFEYKSIAESAQTQSEINRQKIAAVEEITASNKKRIDQVEADTLTNKLAIERHNSQIADMNTAVTKAQTDANKAVADANAATIKAQTAIDTANSISTKVDTATDKANQAIDKYGQLKNEYDAKLAQLQTTQEPQISRTITDAIQELETKFGQIQRLSYEEKLLQEAKQKLAERDRAIEKLKWEQQNQFNIDIRDFNDRQKDQQIKNDLKFEDFKNNVNKQDLEDLNQKLDQTNENIKKIPDIETIALTVAGLDIVKQILTNTQNPALPCQAPTLVPPVGVGVNAANVAIGGMQQVIWSKVHTVGSAVEANGRVLTDPQFGLQKVGQFASTAWKATHADKVMGGVNTALALHNAMMLSNNLLSTISEATNLTLNALGLRDELAQEIDLGELVKNKVGGILTSLLGAEEYKALTERIGKYNRIYQASANMLNITRDMMDSARSVAETTCENTGKIGNALRESGAVYEDAYDEMIDRVNTHSIALKKIDKFRQGLSNLEDGVSSVSEISSEVVEIKENYKELEDSKKDWDKANADLVKDKKDQKEKDKQESTLDTELNKADFSRNEKDII